MSSSERYLFTVIFKNGARTSETLIWASDSKHAEERFKAEALAHWEFVRVENTDVDSRKVPK
jgi:hypothetical protein